MAKLYLTFEGKTLKEVSLAQGDVTIGRLPDNLIQIDNLAVSGHHAHIYWDTDHYVVEDKGSLNGTYVNEQRVTAATLKDGDHILVGKHKLEFKDAWHEDTPAEATQQQPAMPAVPTMHATMVLDTKKAKEMLAAAKAAQAGAPAAAAAAAPGSSAPTQVPQTAIAQTAAAPRDRTGLLTVLAGKTDQPQYVLTGKLTVIGKSEMASIKIKGWFAPQVAAMISKRDNKYFIASQDKGAKLKVNNEDVAKEHDLQENDVIDVAGIKMSFGYE